MLLIGVAISMFRFKNSLSAFEANRNIIVTDAITKRTVKFYRNDLPLKKGKART